MSLAGGLPGRFGNRLGSPLPSAATCGARLRICRYQPVQASVCGAHTAFYSGGVTHREPSVLHVSVVCPDESDTADRADKAPSLSSSINTSSNDSSSLCDTLGVIGDLVCGVWKFMCTGPT